MKQRNNISLIITTLFLFCFFFTGAAQPALSAEKQAAATQKTTQKKSSQASKKQEDAKQEEAKAEKPATGEQDSATPAKTAILENAPTDDLQEKTAQIASEIQQKTEDVAAEDPWKSAWASQQAELETLRDIANTKEKEAPKVVNDLNTLMRPYEQEAQRLFMLSTSYAKVPRVLEALQRRLHNTSDDVSKLLAPTREEVEKIKETLQKMGMITQIFASEKNPTADMKAVIADASVTRKKLETAATHLETAIAPGVTLLERLQKADDAISTALPTTWRAHYLQGPVSYWEPAFWKNLPAHLAESLQVMQLRLPLEVPNNKDTWQMALIRFLAVLLFLSLVAFICYRSLKSRTDNPVVAHLFRISLPWLILGISVIAASLSSSRTVWYALLGLGNLILIIGQIFLAWDLRRIDKPALYNVSSPLWQLAPLTLAGYLLIYPSIPLQILSIAWIILILLFFVWRRMSGHKILDVYPELAKSIVGMQGFFLWVCLVLAIIGLPIYSMILYMMYLSVAVAIQLSLGCMHLMNLISQNLPKEGMRAVIGNIFIALAAPAVLVLVLGGMSLWILTLPGGIPLLGHYGFSSVKIGDSSFNIVQLLLIISAFYLTRTAIQLTTSFLSKLPERGMRMDATLIPPFQTAMTYAFWAFYGLLVLRFLGLELSSLAMVAGGLSVGIGFGMQTIVNNFLSGLILIFSRSLQEGDVVDVNGIVGQVRKISVRATMVETYDSALIYVPNSEFVSNKLINWTRNSRSVRRQINVGVAYGSDTALVIESLKEVAMESDNVLKFPKPSVLFLDFGDSTLDFCLRYWVEDYNLGVPIDSEIRLAIERKFNQNDIEVAFPQMDLHIKDTPALAAAVQQQAPPRAPKVVTAPVSRAPLVAEGAEDGSTQSVAPTETEEPVIDRECLDSARPSSAPAQQPQEDRYLPPYGHPYAYPYGYPPRFYQPRKAASACSNKILPRRPRKKATV